MARPFRLLTGPIRVTAPLRSMHLATLVSADAVARWMGADGREVEWRAATVAGDLGSQQDLERELAREGLDRAALGREAFVERIHALEAGGRARVQAIVDDLGVTVDLSADSLDGEALVRAARTAFVRLYDAGRVIRSEQVVDVCPRCETVVGSGDSEPVLTAATRWLLRLGLLDDPQAEPLTVGIVALELLAGGVAIAVPYGHHAAGATVRLPVADCEVPVLTADLREPALLVPAHDELAWNISRQLGLAPVEVLDAEGIVRAAGPLDGLPRFAAREQAATLLVADLGPLAVAEPISETTHRCRRCGTTVVPRLGRYWLLAMADFELAAADMVRSGQMTFYPPSVGDELVARAGDSGPWCLSRQVWGGQLVPVATCLDCGQRAVRVDADDSCGKCMGVVEPDGDVLDAQFIAAVWPLAVAGWPDHERAAASAALDTMALVAPGWLAPWAVPSIALGLALAGVSPFSHLAVLGADDPPQNRDVTYEADLAALLAAEGRAVARTTLVRAGCGEGAEGALLPAGLSSLGGIGSVDPAAGVGVQAADDGDPSGLAGLAAAVSTAYRQGAPGAACRLLTDALAAGIAADPAAHDLVRRLAEPIVGED